MLRFVVATVSLTIALPSLAAAQETRPLEERVAELERRVEEVERVLATLTNAGSGTAVETTESGTSPLPIRLVRKYYRTADYEDYISLEFEFTNNLEKPIRAFTGVVVFQDLFDRDILRVNLTVEESFAPGESVKWQGGIDYNQFLDEHQRLRSIDQADLQTKFELEMVMYQDGTRERFESPGE